MKLSLKPDKSNGNSTCRPK